MEHIGIQFTENIFYPPKQGEEYVISNNQHDIDGVFLFILLKKLLTQVVKTC